MSPPPSSSLSALPNLLLPSLFSVLLFLSFRLLSALSFSSIPLLPLPTSLLLSSRSFLFVPFNFCPSLGTLLLSSIYVTSLPSTSKFLVRSLQFPIPLRFVAYLLTCSHLFPRPVALAMVKQKVQKGRSDPKPKSSASSRSTREKDVGKESAKKSIASTSRVRLDDSGPFTGSTSNAASAKSAGGKATSSVTSPSKASSSKTSSSKASSSKTRIKAAVPSESTSSKPASSRTTRTDATTSASTSSEPGPSTPLTSNPAALSGASIPSASPGGIVKIAGSRGQPGSLSARLCGRRPQDIKKAKESLMQNLLKIKDFEKFAVAGQPNWEFIRQTWPYGYPDRTVQDIFSRGLTLKPGTTDGYCSAQDTISRLGFEPSDVPEVLLVSQVAFYALLAMEIHEAPRQCLSKDMKYFKPYNIVAAKRVFESHPLVHKWKNPDEEWLDSLNTQIGRNENLRLDENESIGGPNSPGIDEGDDNELVSADAIVNQQALVLRYMREEARCSHDTFVWNAVCAIFAQLWQRASSTYLQSRKQQNASGFTQWNEIRQLTLKSDVTYEENPFVAEYWLPEYHVAMKQPLSSIEEHAIAYIEEIFEHHEELRISHEEEEARKIALETENRFLNLLGGDQGDVVDRIERWAHAPNCPALFISSALATGISITHANILVFAQLNSNELEDEQVKGAIVRSGQTRPCWIYKVRMSGTYDDKVRMHGKSKSMNQSAFDCHLTPSKLVELCDLEDIIGELPTWERWCENHNITNRPVEVWNRGCPLLPRVSPTDDAMDLDSDESQEGSHAESS
ncbi:hypothetical protein sr13956 [Sporisorium reilianum SRZ2]|uniref:Helicase C-terminal domain-containing protein n=1 Tax=Sporisorium reilianum (strain SRZ2) TaxID=999809 RepID=E7A1D9_SPORE|nr:hypothetical protein sr13956 [Sporisorium reilianum SRZ2]